MDDKVQRLRSHVLAGLQREAAFAEQVEKQDAEIERLREMNSNLTDKANHYMIRNARIEEENARLRAEISARNDGWAEIQIGENK